MDTDIGPGALPPSAPLPASKGCATPSLVLQNKIKIPCRAAYQPACSATQAQGDLCGGSHLDWDLSHSCGMKLSIHT